MAIVDFDLLSRTARESNAEMGAMNELWGAAFSLDKWHFVARGTAPDVHPYIASNAAIADNKPMVKAFTDTTKLDRFARENGLVDAEGNVAILSIPIASALSYVEQFAQHGVWGIHFNADRQSEGFFGPLSGLAGMKRHLDATFFANKA